MAPTPKKSSATWSDVKSAMAEFDRAGLLGTIQDLYAASKDTRAFLHARFGLGPDALDPYKATIARSLWPDLSRNQLPSVAAAKKAIADYKKAIGQPDGLAELMVFYCEQAAGFGGGYSCDDGRYFNALVRMFEQALKVSITLRAKQRDTMLHRLAEVRRVGDRFGSGIGYGMDHLLARYTRDGAAVE